MINEKRFEYGVTESICNSEAVVHEPIKEPDQIKPDIIKNVEIVINTIKPEPVNQDQSQDKIIDLMLKESIKPEPDILKPVIEPVNQNQIISLTIPGPILKHVLNLQKLTSDEQLIKFYKNHIELNSVDPAHVMMVKQKIPIYNVLEYKYINNDKELNQDYISIGLDIDKLVNGLKNIIKNTIVKIDYNNEKNIIKLFNGLFNQDISLIDQAGIPEPKIPILNLPAKFIVKTKTIYDFLVQADKISDYITIITSKNDITLLANNNNNEDKISMVLDNTMFDLLESDNTYKSSYPVDYMLNIFKYLKNISESITISFNNDNPIKITTDKTIDIEILLAPRIETE